MKVGELYETPRYKRRLLTLGSGPDNCIDVVLWGETASNVSSDMKNQELTLSALVMEDKELRSTPSTVLEAGGVNSVDGVIVAVGDENDGYPVDMYMDNDSVLYIPEDLHFDFNINLPCRVNYSANSFGCITDIQFL
ncbi:uncharacterized protein [Antedon mediterranea]